MFVCTYTWPGIYDIIQKARSSPILKVISKIVDFISKMVLGALVKGADFLEDGVLEAVDEILRMVDSMEIVSLVIQQIEALERMADDITHQLE